MPDALNLTTEELLTTTRAVRKRLDFERPVPIELVRECIELAVQAPSGSNQQGWHWIVVTDEAKRQALGSIYQRAFGIYKNMPAYAERAQSGDPVRDATQLRVASSAQYLADHMGEAPVLVIPCIEWPAGGVPAAMSAGFWGSLLPAAWSFCLAARARALGTAWTTLHLTFEEEVADLLGVPYSEIRQGALLPVAFTKGTDFKPGPRRDLDAIVHIERW